MFGRAALITIIIGMSIIGITDEVRAAALT
jgi:hypothetical protein